MSATDHQVDSRKSVVPWDIHDIADFYKVSVRTVQRWVTYGQLPRPFILGRKKLWIQNQVMDWMQRKGLEAQESQAARNLANFEFPSTRRGMR